MATTFWWLWGGDWPLRIPCLCLVNQAGTGLERLSNHLPLVHAAPGARASGSTCWRGTFCRMDPGSSPPCRITRLKRTPHAITIAVQRTFYHYTLPAGCCTYAYHTPPPATPRTAPPHRPATPHTLHAPPKPPLAASYAPRLLTRC